jgi:hypothetical protein
MIDDPKRVSAPESKTERIQARYVPARREWSLKQYGRSTRLGSARMSMQATKTNSWQAACLRWSSTGGTRFGQHLFLHHSYASPDMIHANSRR